MARNCILTDCVCDLSNEFMEAINVEPIRFYMHLDTGTFMDRYEISADNVIEYYEEKGTMIVSAEPSIEEYAQIYRTKLREFEHVIHFTISSKVSNSYFKSMRGLELLSPQQASRVHIIDTLSISSGMAILLVRASKMNSNGASFEAIINEMNSMIPRIDVEFLALDAKYLVINNRVRPWVAKFCSILRIRPVFAIKSGNLVPSRFEYGKREAHITRFINHRLAHQNKIDTDMVFIPHSSCSKDELDLIVSTVKRIIPFKSVYTFKTSATVTCNCGAGAFGIVFIHKK